MSKVTIDSENRGQLNDIVQRMNVHRPGDLITPTVDRLQAALRELNREPGIGAVVRDCRGRRWARGPKGWTNLDATGQYLNWKHWEDRDEPLAGRCDVLYRGEEQ